MNLSAALLQPHYCPGVPLLCVDGDGLAYYCAGADGTPIEQAHTWVQEMLADFTAMANPARVKILLTAESSPKGGRYAVATVKPYQGQRKNSRRPQNWQALRRYLEAGRAGEVHIAEHAEADDLFAYYSAQHDHKIAIATQDKDMRMVPGLHLIWDRQRMFWVPPGSSPHHGGKQYGERWFWEQMLQGDTADNIPGLPLLYGKLCGEKRARDHLADFNDGACGPAVERAYHHLYGEFGFDRFVEQACLLWMRRKPADPLDMAAPGGPLHDPVFMHPELLAALERLRKRATGETDAEAQGQ